MANPEHLEILKQGVKFWNQWRRVNLRTIPDLTNAYLYDTELICADLVNANLAGAVLSRAFLISAKLRNANLSKAYLDGADLTGAFLTNVDLSGASLRYTILRDARLINANLSNAVLISTNLHGADIRGADLSNAKIGWLSFGGNDIGFVKGLNSVDMNGPISVDIESIYRSGNNMPIDFLRRTGIPDKFITYLPSLICQAITFNSCFISYSNKDLAFASKLYKDLRDERVQCWFAPEDLKIGAEIRTDIDKSIRVHDKLLLTLSEASIKSQWVHQEVETALAKEREQGRTVLFPIRLDDAVMMVDTGWPSYLRNTRNIGDFTAWKDHDSYQKAFDRLLRDLKAEEKKEPQSAEG